MHKLNKYFWILTKPFWPLLRVSLLKIERVRRKGRFKFYIGRAKKADIEGLRFFLMKKGFNYNRFSFVDRGEAYSLRKLDGNKQFHVRIYKDGEVRVHYEIRPEIHLYKHIKEIEQEEGEEEFSKLLGPWLEKS